MNRYDSDYSPVAAKLQPLDLSGKALYKNQIIINNKSYISLTVWKKMSLTNLLAANFRTGNLSLKQYFWT